MAHSVGVDARRISPIMTQMVSAERGGLAQQVLELGENLSIGFRFGERTDVAVATVVSACWHLWDIPTEAADVCS